MYFKFIISIKIVFNIRNSMYFFNIEEKTFLNIIIHISILEIQSLILKIHFLILKKGCIINIRKSIFNTQYQFLMEMI